VRGIAATGAGIKSGVSVASAPPAPGARLASQYQCVACHAMDRKLVGPSFADIAGKYKGQRADAAAAADPGFGRAGHGGRDS
jgi:cytochrome c